MNDSQRFLAVIFCDDIRVETGNKFTLVGCYGADLLLPQFPATLPKLGAYVRIYTPIATPVKQLKLRLTLNSDVLGEMEVAANQLEHIACSENSPDKTWGVFTTVSIISPLTVREPGDLCVEGETELGGLIPARLKIHQMPADYNPVSVLAAPVNTNMKPS